MSWSRVEVSESGVWIEGLGFPFADLDLGVWCLVFVV